ncbi:MAG: LysR family transcriptional regulator [Paracoccaceae bacterium]
MFTRAQEPTCRTGTNCAPLAVARHGTVSGAAAALGVHHATVIRHVDALEADRREAVPACPRLCADRSRRRSSQGGEGGDDQFSQLASRLKGGGAEVTGDLVVTTLPDISPIVAPAFASFRRRTRA